MSERFDVVVVGAGPVGLLMAIELKLAGVVPLVLERLGSPSRVTKALGLGPLGVEALVRRGMAASLDAAEARAFAAIREFAGQGGPDARGGGGRIGGHFGGLSLIRSDAQREPGRRARPVDQHAIEAMLADRVGSLGIEVRRGCDVVGFAEDADGVGVECATPAGSAHLRCSYLVGCDGGRGQVRSRAGIDFPGTPATMTMYTAVVGLDHPERLAPGGWRRTSAGVFAFGPFPGRLFLLDFAGPPADREAPVTREEIEAVLRRISVADVRVERLESGSRWGDNTRLADSYRRGRVFLAGDAAHVHSPFGGQGMSLGLCDAANLGPKLAAVARGAMPDALLDTYTAERRPVAEAVLANTRAQAAIMRPDPQSGAMRDLMATLMQFDDVNRLIGSMVTGLATHHDLGSDRDEVGRPIGDRPVADGTLYDLMQGGQGVLIDATGGGAASRIVAATTDAVRCVETGAGPSLLIRPDACVAWAGDGEDTGGLVESIRRWFAPAGSAGGHSHSMVPGGLLVTS